MAVKIWRHEVHALKQNTSLEAFIDQIQLKDGDVQNIKTLQTSTKGSVKRNTASPQFMDNRETLSNSTTSATIVAVVFNPYPPQLQINPDAFKDMSQEDQAKFVEGMKNSTAILYTQP